MRLSANTGYLFRDRPFPERIRAAAAAGFDAVEFHDEAQRADPAELAETLGAAALPVLSLNTRMGETAGCAALEGFENQALADFRAALAVADAVDARAIHVLSGVGTGSPDILAGNLAIFADLTDRTLLIEPISRRAMPGYVLNSFDQAARVLDGVGRDNLRILLDCFHALAEGDDPATLLVRHGDRIGHVQIAAFPSRGVPGDEGPDYRALIPAFRAAGIDALGCEFHPGNWAPDAPDLCRRIGL